MLITQNDEAKLIVMDVRRYEENEEAMALIKLLALGNREIEQGKFRPAADVFADIDPIPTNYFGYEQDNL